MTARRKEILYLHVHADTKRWLKALAKKQVGRVSQSTMAEQLLIAARKLGIFSDKRKRSKSSKGASK